ncbi:ATP-dependent RNA helicase HrpA [Deltaproteobacteria bacterium TL4]
MMTLDSTDWDALDQLIEHSMLRDQWQLRSRFKKLQKQAQTPKPVEQDYLRLLERAEASSRLKTQRASLKPALAYPELLPISKHQKEIIETLQKHQVVIIAGETGSGKTTQIPKMCLEAGQGIQGKIGVTQPRRIAATSITNQLAKELQSEVGQLVGYKIRFAEAHSPLTLIQLMTDGILLAETQSDPFLKAYDTLIIDEAHERSLNIDFLLGYLKNLLPKRPELKLIITSASIDIERFSKFFNDAPILEVSGRMYPVDIEYLPIDELNEGKEELSVEEAVIQTVNSLLSHTWEGDILVFLPGEREIREVLKGLRSSKQAVEFLPLFSRLTQKEQNRIFQENSPRKVIVATNIAETSLTIPGIRYVVDSGFARISRYNYHSQIQRLPVEYISQSSARQRSGRAGRVEAGKCLRLYSEELLSNQLLYTEPEIKRSNLAGVILQMLALKLGEISDFPFIDPPSATTIRQGFQLLRELKAVNDQNQITPLGQEMARLPVEPRIACILLQAHHEKALHEVLVIAAGLSIRDPREYPEEQKGKALQMHRLFIDPSSDFITLLNIWKAYHEQWEQLQSSSQMRKFCQTHFLSFSRMREWRDIYHQLFGIIKESKNLKLNQNPADYAAIHKSILTGYLGYIAMSEEKGIYRCAQRREARIFPGSGVLKNGKRWIVAAELVETSFLYARMVANIEVDWLEHIAGTLCKRSYSEAHFDEESQKVIAYEKVTLFGLTLVPRRKTAYGKVNPAEATSIFIREGLIEGQLKTHHAFLKHNQELKHQFQENGAKLRRTYDYEIELAQEAFYQKHLHNVFSIHDLNRILKQKAAEKEERFLWMKEADLSVEMESPLEAEFPSHWQIGEEKLKLHYQYAPQSDQDGVTLEISENMLPFIQPYAFDWLVPGQWEEKIVALLKTLPKALRKQFVPLPQTASLLVNELKPVPTSFAAEITHRIQRKYGMVLPPEALNDESLPDYLRMRIEIKDAQGQVIASGRAAEHLINDHQQKHPESHSAQLKELKEWKDACEQWELHQLQTWSFDKLPQQIEIGVFNGIPLYAYPGLLKNDQGLHRCLFNSQEEARLQTRPALYYLFSLTLGEELAWLEHHFNELRELEALYFPFGKIAQLKEHSRNNLYATLFDGPWIETQKAYQKRLEKASLKLKGLWPAYKSALEKLLKQYQQTYLMLNQQLRWLPQSPQTQEFYEHLEHLLPHDFVQIIPYDQWRQVMRYLKAIEIRVERLVFNPEKDLEKFQQLKLWLERYQKLKQQQLTLEGRQHLNTFRWMLEEFRLSLFAPELKTAGPISAKRLENFLTQHC